MPSKLNNSSPLKTSSRHTSDRVGLDLKRLPALASAFTTDAKAAKQKYERTEFIRNTTPKPDEDSSKGTPNVSSREMSGLATSGRGSLQDPGNDEDMPASMNDAAIIDPFGRVKAKRDSQSYPTGEAKGAGNMQLPTGNVWDSLIQPVDPDGNTPSPINPSTRL